MISLTIEQLKKAREIGATHYYKNLYLKSGIGYNAAFFRNDEWEDDRFHNDPNGIGQSAWLNEKIDFTPLDEL